MTSNAKCFLKFICLLTHLVSLKLLTIQHFRITAITRDQPIIRSGRALRALPSPTPHFRPTLSQVVPRCPGLSDQAEGHNSPKTQNATEYSVAFDFDPGSTMRYLLAPVKTFYKVIEENYF
jgi:hypothetical protein